MKTIALGLLPPLCLLLFGGLPGPRAAEPPAPADFLPTIEDTIHIREWQFLGPFSVGYREGIQSVIPYPEHLTPSNPSPGGRDAGGYRGILPQGGLVTWKEACPDSSGWVGIEFDNVLWDTIMDIYGYAGLVNKTFAYAEVEAGCDTRALVIAERVGTFYLNAETYHGGPYGHDFVRVPVVLKKGTNPIVLSLSGFGGHRFRFEIIPAEAPVILLDDFTTPDLIAGETGPAHIGVAVLNTTGRRLDEVFLTIGDGITVRRREAAINSIAPLCVKKVPVEIDIVTAPSGPPGPEVIHVPVSVAYRQTTFADSIAFRVREPGRSFKRTFISEIDGSCQYYAVLPPEDYDPGREYALILTLHGAGVRAEGQVDAYKAKPWAFVVAPTNRRPFGFDWQDWGRLDALEVLDLAKRAFPIDTARVYLTGHSMGGHGAWHVGLSHADRFTAMAPEAGWTSFELYIPWFLQRGYMYGDPRQVGMRDLALLEDRPLNFVENARNLPVFIVHGGVDDNVPTMHGRMFAQRLEALCYDYEYLEVPDRGHWWHDDSLDVSCVDLPEVMDFLSSQRRDTVPRDVVLKTVNLATSHRTHWADVVSQEVPMQETVLSAASYSVPGSRGDETDGRTTRWRSSRVPGPTIEVKTRNISEFTLRPPPEVMPAGAVVIRVDGRDHRLRLDGYTEVTFSKRAGKFKPGPTLGRGPAKTPQLYGPIKQAYFRPFVLVYGTQAESRTQQTTHMLMHQARSQAFQWWRRGNGYVDVIPDTLVDDHIIDNYNLILFGGPSENSIVGRIGRHLPISVEGEGIAVGSHIVEGSRLAAEFIYPNPLNPERFVVVHMAADYAGLGLSDFFKTLYAGAGLPDFIVFDDEVRTRGWAGVICTGFFDSDWRVEPGLMFRER